MACRHLHPQALQAGAHFLPKKTSLFHKEGGGQEDGARSGERGDHSTRLGPKTLEKGWAGLCSDMLHAGLQTGVQLPGPCKVVSLPGTQPSQRLWHLDHAWRSHTPYLDPASPFNWMQPASTPPAPLSPPLEETAHFHQGKTKPAHAVP